MSNEFSPACVQAQLHTGTARAYKGFAWGLLLGFEQTDVSLVSQRVAGVAAEAMYLARFQHNLLLPVLVARLDL
jgi:hypothetical protein